MEKQRRRDARGIVGKIAAVVFAAGFVLSIVPAIRALAEGTIFKIQSAEITEISTGATGSINTYDEQTIVSNVTFHKINDSISYKIVLQNSDSKDHIIESITDDNASESINYIYDAHAGETVAAGANLDFLLTAKYATAVTDTNRRAEVSNVKFFIKFTDVEEPEEIDIVVPNTDAETPVVPDTGANTKDSKGAGISLATMIISVVGLTVLALIAVKKHKKYAKIIGVAVVAVSAFGLVTSARAANIETNSFTLTTSYGLYDKLVIKNGDTDVVISYGEKLEDVDEITEPTKPGYTFNGWEDENGNPVDPTKPITEDITIKPKFTANTYTVKFDANGGDGTMADLAMTFGEPKNLPANAFTWDGRTYTGWDTEANGSGAHYGDEAEATDLTTEDNAVVTLYAQWSINPFHIDYDGNGATGGEMATTNCEYDETCILRNNAFTRTGYDFAGWEYNGTNYANKADVKNIITSGTITMVAQWTVHVYSIEYTGLTTEEAATLRAQGNPDEYTIETGAFTLIKPADRKDADGDVREHCIGWRDITVYEDITLPIANALGDKKYEAVWQTVALPEYNITYDYDGGNVTTANPVKHNKEQSFTLNEPVKEGYTFLGWTGTTIEGSTPVKPYTLPALHVRSDIEFTAHYHKNGYQVAFNINTDDTHVSGNMANMTGLEYDTNYDLTANAFTRTGYTFEGWNTQADGQGESFTDGQQFSNLTAEDGATVTLYAKWAPTQYTIVFHANNENVENPNDMASQVVAYDKETTLNPLGYTWWQHKLVEWTTNANGTGTKYADKATIKNLDANGGEIHLYAKWREIDAALKAGSVGVSPTGRNINALLTANPGVKRFVKYTAGTPSAEVLANAVDTSGTIDPIWLWVEGENLYWWSEDVKPRISSNLTSTDCLFNGAGTYTVDGQTKHLEYADLTGFDTSNITDYGRTFHSCGISEIDISDWDFSHATNMSEFIAWGVVKKATFPEVVDARNVTNMNLALNFGMVTDELDLSGWKTRDVKNLSNFLSGMQAKKIKFSSDFKTNNVENMASMFYGNSKLTSIEGLEYFDTAKVKNMSNMFASVSSMESLDLSTFSTAALTEMKGMFNGMTGLTSLTLGGSFKANDVTDFTGTFKNLRSLQTIDLSNLTSTPTDMSNMFESGSAAKVIDISGMDLSAVTKFTWTFISCGSLETIYVSNNPNPDNITDDGHIFLYSGPKIVGGAGSNHLGSAASTGNGGGSGQSVYARIDDPCNGNPGYFTWKDHRYVCYYANYDNANQTTAGQYIMTTASDHLATKPITRQGYTLLGWSTTPGGEIVYADGAEIETEFSKDPIKLYAHWEPMDVTITFHSNFDGVNDTMAQQTITVGEQNNLNANQYSVDHYRFLGWTTEPQGKVMGNESTAIDYADQASTAGFVGDTDLYAKWLYRCRTFATDSWNTIVTNLESDSTYYDATDVCEKEIQMDLNDDSVKETYGLRLINTSTPEECSTPGFSQTACGTVIEFTNYVGIWKWNSVNSTNGGWANATLATRLNGEDLYGKMPEELRSVIIPTYPIVSGANQNGGSPDITASDTNKNKIYLHTGKELGVPNSAFDDKEDLTRTYDFYGVSEHKPYLNRAGGGQWNYDWWLRSAVLSRDNIPLGIKSDVRSMISATPGANNNVATYPAFRIGRKLTVSFNAGEGAASETAREYAVSAMNYSTLPTVTTAPEGKIFAGWYTAAEGGDRVNDNDTFVSSNAHTLYAHWITPTFYNITEMQQMTADICATATTPNTNASQFDTTGENVGNKSYIPRRELIDNRDGKIYQVTKLADGKCWMTENLAIGDPDSTMTLTSADSDVTSSLTLPQSNIAAFTGSADVDAVYVDDTFGGYYSSKAARAGYAEAGGSSICPKGWRLPDATTSNPRDWENLKSTYDIAEYDISSVNALYGEPFNFTRSFYVSNGAIKRNNGWMDTYYVGPGTTSNSYNNFGVTISDPWTGTSRITGAEGGSVRCVAR